MGFRRPFRGKGLAALLARAEVVSFIFVLVTDMSSEGSTLPECLRAFPADKFLLLEMHLRKQIIRR